MSIEGRAFRYIARMAKKGNLQCFSHGKTYKRRLTGQCPKCRQLGFEAKVQEAWIHTDYAGYSRACSSCRLVLPCSGKSRGDFFRVIEILCLECYHKFYEIPW